jgi:hypothetical protein
MRVLKESVLQIWKPRNAAVREEVANAEHAAKSIQDTLDRLDEAFLFERSIDIDTYDRHAEKLRETWKAFWSSQNAFCRAPAISGCRPHSTPAPFQQLLFPDGIAFDGNRIVGTGATAPAFSYLREIRAESEGLVDQTGVEPVTS